MKRDLSKPLASTYGDPVKKKVKKGKSPVSAKDAFMLKRREATMRNEIKENAANPDSKKRAASRTQNQVDSALRRKAILAAKKKGGKLGYGK